MRNKIFLLTTFFLFYNLDLFSQCAMCKAVVESNMETGSQIGRGLNNGILLLEKKSPSTTLQKNTL